MIIILATVKYPKSEVPDSLSVELLPPESEVAYITYLEPGKKEVHFQPRQK